MMFIRSTFEGKPPAVYAIWVLLLVMMGLTLIAAPFRLRELSQPCVDARCVDDHALPTPEVIRVLENLGFTIRDYANYQFAVGFLQVMISWLLAVILLLRGDPGRMTLVIALYLSLGGFSNTTLNAIPEVFFWTVLPVAVLQFTSNLLFILVFYLFPDGHFTPAWTRWLVLILVIDELVLIASSAYSRISNQTVDLQWFGDIDAFVWLGTFLVIVATQIYRYNRVSSLTQKLQTRWVVFGISITLIFAVALVLIGEASGGRSNPGFRLFYVLVTPWLFIPILLTLGFAILRYRLFDIDVIIRKTLVYGVLTTLLALVFFGGVTLLQQAFSNFTGTKNSPIAIVLSTLAIAALSAPLRRRIQDIIDRRFYRQKYNAEQALAEFALAARNETDLAQLSNRLTGTVQATLQPENVILWLTQHKK